MALKSYRELVAWKRSFELAKAVYDLTKAMPKEELYGMTSQMRRAAVSVSANIAEGYSRQTRKDYVHFLSISRGSLAELQTLLLLAKEIHGIEQVTEVERLLEQTSYSLSRLQASLKDK